MFFMTTRLKVAISLVSLVIVGIMLTRTIDGPSLEYTEDGFRRSLITYGVARGLNGVISVAQGTELAIEPVGIGLTFAPGQILDPVNDLIERFSWVVLASGTSLGVQRVLINITTWEIFSYTAAASIIISLLLLWLLKTDQSLSRTIFYKLTFILLVLRFSVPIIAISSEAVYSVFLSPIYEESSEQLQQASLSLENLNDQTQAELQLPESDSIFESARQRLFALSQQIDIDKRLEQFTLAAENISENAINLIVVFIMQTLFIPLLFAWLIIQLIKFIINTKYIH
jgi:hypothetical protein